jgi:uncharacterized phiE125 gp8 family phage protein
MYPGLGHLSLAPVSTGTSTEEPVSVASLLAHLRLGSSSEASAADLVLVAEKIPTARRTVENRTERSLLRNQFDQAIERFPCDGSAIRLLRSPLVSVESVTWYGTTGGATVLSTDAYFVDTYSERGRLCLNSGYCWPTATRRDVGAVIRFTAGYSTDASGIPDPLKEAVRKLATELYENREASSLGNSVNEPLPFGIEELISDYIFVEIG